MNTATPSVGSAASAAAPRDVSPIEAVTSQIGDAQQHTHTLITDLLSALVIEATGPLMLGESAAPAGPVLWLNHDIIARQLNRLHA